MSSEEKNKVLSRIKKMLALGRNEGATEAERETAMRMANNLMSKYNLDIAEAEAHGAAASEPRGFVKGDFYGRPWARVAAHAIAKLFFCEYVYVSATRANDTTHYFFGRQSNATVALSMAEYVVRSIQREAATRGRHFGNAWKRSFAIGASTEVYNRVQEMIKANKETPAAPGMSLVLANVYTIEHDKNVAVIETKFGKSEDMKKGRSGKSTGNVNAAAEGRKYGKSINLNRQVTGSTQKVLT